MCVSADASAFGEPSWRDWVTPGRPGPAEAVRAGDSFPGARSGDAAGVREESSFAPPAASPPCVASSTTSPQCGVPQALGVRELARVLCLCPAPPRGAPSLLGVLGVLGTPRQHRGHVLSRPFASHCMDVAELGASAGHCPHF